MTSAIAMHERAGLESQENLMLSSPYGTLNEEPPAEEDLEDSNADVLKENEANDKDSDSDFSDDMFLSLTEPEPIYQQRHPLFINMPTRASASMSTQANVHATPATNSGDQSRETQTGHFRSSLSSLPRTPAAIEPILPYHPSAGRNSPQVTTPTRPNNTNDADTAGGNLISSSPASPGTSSTLFSSPPPHTAYLSTPPSSSPFPPSIPPKSQDASRLLALFLASERTQRSLRDQLAAAREQNAGLVQELVVVRRANAALQREVEDLKGAGHRRDWGRWCPGSAVVGAVVGPANAAEKEVLELKKALRREKGEKGALKREVGRLRERVEGLEAEILEGVDGDEGERGEVGIVMGGLETIPEAAPDEEEEGEDGDDEWWSAEE